MRLEEHHPKDYCNKLQKAMCESKDIIIYLWMHYSNHRFPFARYHFHRFRFVEADLYQNTADISKLCNAE